MQYAPINKTTPDCVKAANTAKMVSVGICASGKIENARFNFKSLDDIPLEFFENVI